MKNQNLKNVTVNTDSTMNQTALSYPPIGYHTLKLLDGLRQSYNDASKRINKVRKNQRISNTTKDKRIKNLENWQKQLKSEFEFWAGIVKKWVSVFDLMLSCVFYLENFVMLYFYLHLRIKYLL